MNRREKGFTLIELLVVIAIIGILSSVVLASLNSARAKGANATVKAQLASMRAQAELYYDGGNTYVGVCTNTTTGIATMLANAKASGAGTGECFDSPLTNSWAASAELKVPEGTNGFWCVGSSGASKATSTNVTSQTSCQ